MIAALAVALGAFDAEHVELAFDVAVGATSLAETKRRVDGLRTGLRRLGYEEGKNIVIHYRWAEYRYDRLPKLAAELVKLNVDVLVTHETPEALAAKYATSTVPIVAAVGDPVEAGLGKSDWLDFF